MGSNSSGAVGGARQTISRAASRARVDIAFAAVDALIVVTSYSVGLGLRMLDPLIGNVQDFWIDLFVALPVIVICHVAANAIAGAYGHVWEYASISEAIRLVVASAAATGAVILIAWGVRFVGLPGDIIIPFLTLAVGGLLSLLMMGMVRFRSRLFSFRRHSDGARILVVGTSAQAAHFARNAGQVEGGGKVVGFLTTTSRETASVRLLADLPVIGSVDDVAEVVMGESIDQVVLIGSDPIIVSNVVDRCLEIDVGLRILPTTEELLMNGRSVRDVRDIQVEDLLVRDPVATDLSAVAGILQGKRVMVTGGGGSIGSELVRQVMSFGPESVWALDRGETLLHEARIGWPGEVGIVLADIRDGEAVLRAMERIRPDVVFHAAALKHVPLLESHPEEAVLTNVVGTLNLIEATSRVGASRFVLVSTDKAVDPSSVMGATKRVAEMLVKAGEERHDGCTYTAVRFGNVLGSRGSVIPTFVAQIRAGGPVTVTDPKMTRYFMTVDEAVQLVLQAAAMAEGSEIFVLDMGDQVVIEDLARRLIRLAGLIPSVDIAIEYSGVRAGEKLQESLSNGPLHTTQHSKILEVPLSQPDAGVLTNAVSELELAARRGEAKRVVSLLNQLAAGKLGAIETEMPVPWS